MATANDVIIPEVYAGLVKDEVKKKIRISSLAKDLGDLRGDVGDTISFPMFRELSKAQLMQKGTKITTEELTQTSDSKKIVQFGKGVEIYDRTELTALGSFIDNAILQQSNILANAIDEELVNDINKNVILKVATADGIKITEDELIEGFQKFGDQQNNADFEAIVINSLTAPSFYKMDGFIKKDSTYSAEKNGQVINGIIGFYRGTIPVMLCDSNTFDSTKKEVTTFIIKKDALAKMPKRDLLIELDRKADFKRTDVYADTILACGMIKKDGVCVLRKTITPEEVTK
ncbi:UNVERIFIED_ORG: hypothetical protein B2H93_14780 [Clostridium botulinum]